MISQIHDNKSLDNDVQWRAVVECDHDFDGLFFYGLKTTGIFCRPSCKSKTPSRPNVLFFRFPSEALAIGLRPCKRCRPDLVAFDPNEEVLSETKRLLEQSFADPSLWRDLRSRHDIGGSQLSRIFQEREGCTICRYLTKLRIENAKRLLRESDLSVTMISLECGYDSLSNFYKQFKRFVDVAPNEYRQEQCQMNCFDNSPKRSAAK